MALCEILRRMLGATAFSAVIFLILIVRSFSEGGLIFIVLSFSEGGLILIPIDVYLLRILLSLVGNNNEVPASPI